MKKVLCLCFAILLITLTGCQKAERSDTETLAPTTLSNSVPNDGTSNNVNDEIQYVIYAASSAGEITGLADAANAPHNISFGSLSERDFSYSRRNNTANENAKAQKMFTLGSLNLTATYSKSFTNSLATSLDNNLHKFGQYDEYRSADYSNSFVVRFRQADGELAFFATTNGLDDAGNLTEQNAKLLADAYLIEKYGKQFTTEYPNCSIVVTDKDTEKTISICYTKYVFGYPTTDRVIVTYNMNGEIISFNGMTKGLFDSVTNNITAEKISNAENALINIIPETWAIGTKKLVLDADGAYYLYINASQIKENTDGSYDGMSAMEFYINID